VKALALRTISRKVKMELLAEDGDITEMLFAHHTAQKACRMFLEELKLKNGFTRKEMNAFATALGSGKLGHKYSRVRFYMQIRKTLLTLGLIGIQQRYVDTHVLEESELSPEKKTLSKSR
jgi:hypothetical protein